MESCLWIEHAVLTCQVKVQIPSRVEESLTKAASLFSIHTAKRGAVCYCVKLTLQKFMIFCFISVVDLLSPRNGRDSVHLKVNMEGTSWRHATRLSE